MNTNRVLAVNRHIRDDVMALKARRGLKSVNEVLTYLLLKEEGYTPLHKRTVEELEALLAHEPSNSEIRSALLIARAGVE